MALSLVSAVWADPPVISSTEPKSFMVHDPDDSTYHHLIIHGKNFAPPGTSGLDAKDRIKAYLKVGDQMYQLSRNGWSNEKLHTYFLTTPWLDKAGSLEVVVTADGVRSNTFKVPIIAQPTAKPEVRDVSPSKFIIGEGTKDNDFLFRIRANNLVCYDRLGVSINNKGVTIGWMSLDGVIDVYLPEELRNKPGKYPVAVSTPAGASNTVFVEVMTPAAAKPNTPAKPPVQISTGPTTMSARPNLVVPPAARPGLVMIPSNQIAALTPFEGVVVTLTGKVKTAAERLNMEQAAYDLPGVVRVENNLEIEGKPAAPIRLRLPPTQINPVRPQ